ncbi:MAG: hypothetical protein K8R69_09330, partial [Deltaproteobacteria bacterium]|nr:hypothetical protein [Deltaproteobacteria bacterium]
MAAKPTADFGALLEGMPQSYQGTLRSQLSPARLAELTELAKDSDPAMFWRGITQFARRLEEDGNLGAASLLLQGVSRAPRELPEIRASAQRELGAILGSGATGPRFEHLLRRFAGEVSDPWMLAGFGVGSLVFKGTKLYALSRLWNNPGSGFFTRGLGATMLASAAGLTAEVPAFVLTSKIGRQVSGIPQDWSAKSLGHEFASTGLTLFCLKGAGALSSKSVAALRGGWEPLAASSSAFGIFSRFSQQV